MSPSNIRNYIHKVSPTRLSIRELSVTDTNKHTKLDGEKFTSLQPYTKNYRKVRKAENGREVFPGEEHTKWLSSASQSEWKHTPK